MMDDENRPGPGIRAYAQRLKDLPGPAGDGAKMAAGGLTVGAAPAIGSNLPAPRASGSMSASSIGDLGGLKASATSQPGISKVTGAGLSSPLYTNIPGGRNRAGAQPAQPAQPTPQGIAAGFDPAREANQPLAAAPNLGRPVNDGIAGGLPEGLARMAAANATRQSMIDGVGIAGPASGLSVSPLGGQAAPQNEGLARMARANAITQERIDALPRGGSAALPDQNAAWNARMERSRQIEDVASLMARNPQVSQGIAAAFNAQAGNVSEETRQKGIAAGINTQRRGQDMNYGAQMAQMGLTARAQDQDAAMGNAKLGIDMAKFGLEQSAMQRQQSAQDNLFRAMDGGDQGTIAKARMMATMAGVKLPEVTKMEPIQTDSGFMVFNPTSGEMRPAVGAEGQPVGSGKPLNEYQGKSTGFGMRAAEASRIIEEVGQGGKVQPSLIKRAAESVPLIGEGLGMAANRLASPEQQQIEQAQRDFINAVLRQESGAVIADTEFDNARKQYFPQPGDSPAVVEQKRANREMAINGFRVSAGPGARNIGNPPAQKQPQQGQQQSAAAPVAGTVDDGYVFLGGNPNDPANWMEARK